MILTEAQISTWRERIKQPLPGWSAQQQMATEVHRNARLKPNADARRAAVLILLYPYNNQIYLPLIVRPVYAGVHSGQVALPGGKIEPEDTSPVAAALRETEEEIGVQVPEAQVIGALSDLYIPPSNFIVTPVLAYTEAQPTYQPDPGEVAKVLDFPLSAFASPDNKSTVRVKAMKNVTLEAPCYRINGRTVWGATAMMMSELLAVLEAPD